MRSSCAALPLLLCTAVLWAQSAEPSLPMHQQQPDQDGIYYVGPEVNTPRMVLTAEARYPLGIAANHIKGMTVCAAVIDVDGVPKHIQLLHTHGDAFDRAAIAAMKVSRFEPGRLGGKAVPVWVDLRVVFRADMSQTTPEILITERDLKPPSESELEDKHHHVLSYVAPMPLHTVDADFDDPFARHPYVQVALVNVLVDSEGMPRDVRVVRGLGFGLDQKAVAAVWHYRFTPALRKGTPIEARRNLEVRFAKF